MLVTHQPESEVFCCMAAGKSMYVMGAELLLHSHASWLNCLVGCTYSLHLAVCSCV